MRTSSNARSAWKAGGFELTLASRASRQRSLDSGPAGRPALVDLVIQPHELATLELECVGEGGVKDRATLRFRTSASDGQSGSEPRQSPVGLRTRSEATGGGRRIAARGSSRPFLPA
jgi:hypothetical protein